MKTSVQVVVPVAVETAVKVAAKAAAAVATDFIMMLLVEMRHGASLQCFDKTLGKNHRFSDFSTEFSIV